MGTCARVNPKTTYGSHVQRAVRGPVSAAVKPVATGLARGGGQGSGTTEHGESMASMAKAASLFMRSGFSPAVIRSWAAISTPMHEASIRSGLIRATRAAINSSRSAISSLSTKMRTKMRLAKERRAMRVAVVGSCVASRFGRHAAQVRISTPYG